MQPQQSVSVARTGIENVLQLLLHSIPLLAGDTDRNIYPSIHQRSALCIYYNLYSKTEQRPGGWTPSTNGSLLLLRRNKDATGVSMNE